MAFSRTPYITKWHFRDPLYKKWHLQDPPYKIIAFSRPSYIKNPFFETPYTKNCHFRDPLYRKLDVHPFLNGIALSTFVCMMVRTRCIICSGREGRWGNLFLDKEFKFLGKNIIHLVGALTRV